MIPAFTTTDRWCSEHRTERLWLRNGCTACITCDNALEWVTCEPTHRVDRQVGVVNQHQAPRGTVATIGHPANEILIVKGADCWRYVDSGRGVDNEEFRCGWDLFDPFADKGVPQS